MATSKVCVSTHTSPSYLYETLMALSKPNVLIDDDSNAHLADFGLSRVSEPTGLTTKSIAGSCRWMAYELMHSDNLEQDVPFTLATDVWALGMTILEVRNSKWLLLGVPLTIAGKDYFWETTFCGMQTRNWCYTRVAREQEAPASKQSSIPGSRCYLEYRWQYMVSGSGRKANSCQYFPCFGYFVRLEEIQCLRKWIIDNPSSGNIVHKQERAKPLVFTIWVPLQVACPQGQFECSWLSTGISESRRLLRTRAGFFSFTTNQSTATFCSWQSNKGSLWKIVYVL